MTEQAMQGTIIKGIGGFYYVKTHDGITYTLRARGIFRKRKLTPLIGDHVTFTPGKGDEEGWIDDILPRMNELIRPPVANISYLIIVIAPKPEPDLLLVDSMLIMARRQSIDPVLVYNKCDINHNLGEKIRADYAKAVDHIFIVSAESKEGLQPLADLLQEGICCFAGQSGVGKSSLVSAVTGIDLDTGEISRKTARGKHTTRHAELIRLKNYQVLDTAGFSLLGQRQEEDPVMLKSYYPEFMPFDNQCRFHPCYHQNEPDCAVLEARDQGLISPSRVQRYHLLLENAKEAWKGRYE